MIARQITRLAAVVLLALLPLMGAAQNAPEIVPIDYEEWARVAERAEEAVAAGRASSEAFEDLRGVIVSFRSNFQLAENANSSRIETVETQIQALGTPPEDGSAENPDIAARRAELTAQLAELRAPGLRAEEAYSRADGLIAEIDRLLRARQTAGLLQLGPSPLNPAHWPGAVDAVRDYAHDISTDLWQVFASPAQRAVAAQSLPLIVGLLVAGLLALLRGPKIVRHVANALLPLVRPSLKWLVATVLSGIGALASVLGIVLITTAFLSTGVVSPMVEMFLRAVLQAVGWVWFSVWLGHVLFPDTPLGQPFLSVSPQDARPARAALRGMGLAAALAALAGVVLGAGNIDVAEGVVIQALVLILCGWASIRFGRVLSHALRGDEAEDDTTTGPTYRDRIVAGGGRILMTLGAVGILAALIGYGQAAEAMLEPLVKTVALSGLLLVLQRALSDLYAAAVTARRSVADTTSGTGLVPDLIGLVLFLGALPVFALLWGARWADLTELWARFLEGVDIGDVRLSPASVLTFLIVFSVGYIVTRILQGTLTNSILPKTKLDQGGRNALVSGVGYIGIFLAALIAITTAGIDLSSLAIVAGALSVGIGFGLQTIVSNFVSGIILLVERPVSEGDWVEVGGVMGTVRKIAVRATTIETFDRTNVIVPNADLITGQVTNWTKFSLTGRIIVNVGVAYGTDTRRVEKILQEIAETHPMVIVNPQPLVTFEGFGADSLDFVMRMILRDVNQSLRVKNEVHHLIAERFVAEGIEIPFAQRDIWLRNPETLRTAPPPPAASPTSQAEAAPAPSARATSPGEGLEAAMRDANPEDDPT